MNPPPKVPNVERRSREHLTPAEIDRLMAAAQRLGRHGHRDATMILLAHRQAFGFQNWSACSASRWICAKGSSMCADARTGWPARIRCAGQNYALCAKCCAMTQKQPTSSSSSAARR